MNERRLFGVRADVLVRADGRHSGSAFHDVVGVVIVGSLDCAATNWPFSGKLPELEPVAADGCVPDESRPAVVLVRRTIQGHMWVFATPWKADDGDGADPRRVALNRWAASGSYIHSRDGRIEQRTGHQLPIPLHDYDMSAEKR